MDITPIKYIDKRNHGLIREYYDKIDEDSKSMAHLFVKDTANSYPLQNEWRFVFFDYNNYFHLGEGDGKKSLHRIFYSNASFHNR